MQVSSTARRALLRYIVDSLLFMKNNLDRRYLVDEEGAPAVDACRSLSPARYTKVASAVSVGLSKRPTASIDTVAEVSSPTWSILHKHPCLKNVFGQVMRVTNDVL